MTGVWRVGGFWHAYLNGKKIDACTSKEAALASLEKWKAAAERIAK